MLVSGNVYFNFIIIITLQLDNENHNWLSTTQNRHIHYLSEMYHTVKNTGQVSTTCLMSYSVSHRISQRHDPQTTPDFSTVGVR